VRFRLVPKSMTLDDLELVKGQMLSKFCPTLLFWTATTAKRMKIKPYYRRQKCRPVTLPANIRCVRIFAGFLLARALNESGVVDEGQVSAISEATSSETSEIMPAILYDDRLRFVAL